MPLLEARRGTLYENKKRPIQEPFHIGDEQGFLREQKEESHRILSQELHSRSSEVYGHGSVSSFCRVKVRVGKVLK